MHNNTSGRLPQVLGIQGNNAFKQSSRGISRETRSSLLLGIPLECFPEEHHAFATIRKGLRQARLQDSGLRNWPEKADADIARILCQPRHAPRNAAGLIVLRDTKIPRPGRVIFDSLTS